jgi:hypothetical protein
MSHSRKPEKYLSLPLEKMLVPFFGRAILSLSMLINALELRCSQRGRLGFIYRDINMKKMLPLLVLTLLCCFSAKAPADFTSVNIDTMSSPDANAFNYFPGGLFTLDRVVSLGGPSNYVQNSGFNLSIGSTEFNYVLTSGGTLQNLFDAYKATAMSPFGTLNPDPAAVFGGIGFDVSNFTPFIGGSNALLSVGATPLRLINITGDGFYSFLFDGAERDLLANATGFSLRVNAFDTFTVSNVYVTAIPEPTTALLTLSILGAVALRRRRIPC